MTSPFVVHRPWHCDPNGIKCEHGHMLKLYKAGYRGDLRNMVGHAFLRCATCHPHTFFLAIFTRDPSPLVTCYPISKESYDEWISATGRTPPTAELLHVLKDPDGNSYHPNWRPGT